MSIGSRVARLLVVATREHDWTAPVEEAVALAAEVPPEAVVEAARYHRVVGCVLASVQGAAATPAPLHSGLAAAARRTTGRTMLAMAALRSVRATLGDEIDWLVLKGPVLDGALYPRPRLRSFRDLDLLVPPAHLPEALARLEAAGYVLVDQNWRLMRERVAGELHLQREGAAPLDLHWTLLFNESLRAVFPFDTEAMIGRARSLEVAGEIIRTFDEVDTLLHLAVHAALEGGDRLVWLKDLDVVVRGGVRWDEVVERARAVRAHLPVASMLARSRRTLGTPVPEDVIAQLAPSAWRALVGVADLAFPPQRSRGFGTPATLLIRSARDCVRTTSAVAARGLWQRASGLAAGQVRREDHRADPTHPGSVLHAAGDADDRDAYFARISGRPNGSTT